MDALKKKIIFFIPSFPVLSETFIQREVEGLYKRGYIDLSVVALKKGNAKLPADLRGIVHYKRADIFDVAFGFAFLRPKGLSDSLGVIFTLGKRPRFSDIFLWLKAVGYAQIFRKFHPTHIHAHFTSEFSTIAMLAAKILNVPFSVSGHAKDVFAKTQNASANPHMLSEKIQSARFVTLCNRKAYEECLKSADDNSKKNLYLINHGIDLSTLTSRIAKESFNITTIYYLGRFVEKKGLKYLVDASKAIKDTGRVFQLLLAGYGPDYEMLSDKVAQLGLSDVVKFVNSGKGVDNNEALDLMARSDIFVMPAIETQDSDSDGIPNTILEAGALKKPVVTTSAGSIPEIIEDNKTGLVVLQKDTRTLSEAIIKLLENKQLGATLGNALYEVVKNKFELNSNLLKLEKLLLSD